MLSFDIAIYWLCGEQKATGEKMITDYLWLLLWSLKRNYEGVCIKEKQKNGSILLVTSIWEEKFAMAYKPPTKVFLLNLLPIFGNHTTKTQKFKEAMGSLSR